MNPSTAQYRVRHKPYAHIDITTRYGISCAAVTRAEPTLTVTCRMSSTTFAITSAREIVGAERLVGLSTHTPQQVLAANGADYIGVGPVHETPTKPGRPPVGLELVRFASQAARVPFFAIGGMRKAERGPGAPRKRRGPGARKR